MPTEIADGNTQTEQKKLTSEAEKPNPEPTNISLWQKYFKENTEHGFGYLMMYIFWIVYSFVNLLRGGFMNALIPIVLLVFQTALFLSLTSFIIKMFEDSNKEESGISIITFVVYNALIVWSIYML